jgi:hypothetical protein
LKIVAVNDLGGLGAKDGSPVVCHWTLPNLLPVLLPWLAILFLLLLKPNRCAQAWWIWVPVGCAAGLGAALPSALSFVPSSLVDILGGAAGALGFGLAAVWLLSAYLGRKHRLLAWLGILLALGSFSTLAFVIRQGLEGAGAEMIQGGILVAASIVVISVAITLAGLVCRGRYGPLRLSLWLIAALLVVWLVVIAPFFVIAMIASPGNVPVAALIGTVLSVAGISFGLLLPFLILSFANGFYRERLKDLLHLGREAPPPVIAPPLPTVMAAGG